MTVADYVMQFLVKQGIKDVFTVSGGGSMFLLDSLGHNKDLRYICNHHEQASAIAAEAYARSTQNFGVCLVSTAPAGTNTLTGVGCAWNDSIPVMFISGQANSKNLIGDKKLRQRGVHEVDIVSLVRPITKYARLVLKPEDIESTLIAAWEAMMSGRPGPVWIDIPVNIQGATVDLPPPGHLFRFYAPLDNREVLEFHKLYEGAEKPVVLLGGGAVHCIEETIKWAVDRNLPIVCTKNAFGYIPADTPNYMRMIGINGNKEANHTIQNADLVISLGSRLALPAVGYNTAAFAQKAKKIIVDIDENNTNWSFVQADLIVNKEVWLCLFSDLPTKPTPAWIDEYRKYAKVVKTSFPYIDPYFFYKELSRYQDKFGTLVTDQGVAFYCWSQAFDVAKGTTSFTNGGFSPMGYGLPAAIGACVATRKPVVAVVGDGGFEMNIQELQTIKHYNLPIKIFVLENEGYNSIKNTQDAYFGSFYVGSDPDSGVSCVSAIEIAKAYGIDFIEESPGPVLAGKDTIWGDGPCIISILSDPHQKITPKVVSVKHEDGSMSTPPLDVMEGE